MKYIDMHCDTLVECYCNDEGLRKNSFHIDFERLKKTILWRNFSQYLFRVRKQQTKV